MNVCVADCSSLDVIYISTPIALTCSMASTTSISAFNLPLSSPRNFCCRAISVRKRLPAPSIAALTRESMAMLSRSGATNDLLDKNVSEVAPLLFPRNAAFHSALRNHFCCSSSSNGSSSSIYQPRPAIILPGLGNNSGDYLKLQAVLEGYGIMSVTANVSRPDWLRNAAGLLDLNYWKGTLRPRPVLDWYLKRVDAAVREAKDLFPGKTASLIGHSAGGWLARVYMEDFGASDISLLLTLGTPHMPPPKGVSGVIDQTRGLLDYVDKYCAKAVYTPELKYVCIAGRYIQGARIFNESSEAIEDSQIVPSGQNDQEVVGIATMTETTLSTSTTTTFRTRFIGQGYKQVCGRADVWGDGVVPEESAYLEGALNIGLAGVYHSPVGSDDARRPWYGSPAVVEQWIDHLLDK